MSKKPRRKKVTELGGVDTKVEVSTDGRFVSFTFFDRKRKPITFSAPHEGINEIVTLLTDASDVALQIRGPLGSPLPGQRSTIKAKPVQDFGLSVSDDKSQVIVDIYRTPSIKYSFAFSVEQSERIGERLSALLDLIRSDSLPKGN